MKAYINDTWFENDYVHPHIGELAIIFPEARQAIHNSLSFWKAKLINLERMYAKVEHHLIHETLYRLHKTEIENKIKINQFMAEQYRPRKDGAITSDDIARAKKYPIDNLIEFNRALFANCISHTERTPSMKYYREKNELHCFSCGKNFDSIGAYMELNNCGFVDAVKKLQ